MRFDRAIIQRDLDITIAPPYFDTLLGALVLDNRGKHGLGALCERYLKHSLDKSHQTSFGGYTLSTPISEAQVSYGAKDAVVLLPLKGKLLGALATRPQVKALVDLEHRFTEVMMEAKPPKASIQQVLTQLSADLNEQLQELSRYWDKGQRQVSLIDSDGSTTHAINLNSLKQIQQGLEKVKVNPGS
jgi:ribonuclease D